MNTLAISTPSPNEICLEREFDAPVPLVWRAFTEPELVQQWLLGPPGHSMPVCEIDFREGGRWRYIWKIPVEEMEAYGVYKSIVEHEKIVHTETFAQWPDGNSLVTTEFIGQGKQTRVKMTIDYLDEKTRDIVLETGMAEGVEAGYQRLDALWPSLSA